MSTVNLAETLIVLRDRSPKAADAFETVANIVEQIAVKES